MAGNPAKVKGWMCQCGIRLHFEKKGKAVCDACGSRFQKKGNEVSHIHG
jgi:UDP-2-acetamido-3-amino-2,3-dideoxy-glucuronate N-acetyltransferase